MWVIVEGDYIVIWEQLQVPGLMNMKGSNAALGVESREAHTAASLNFIRVNDEWYRLVVIGLMQVYVRMCHQSVYCSLCYVTAAMSGLNRGQGDRMRQRRTYNPFS